MRYEFLLFDADYTLLDFKAEETIALRASFDAHAYPFNNGVQDVYTVINDDLWDQYEKGQIEKQEIIDTRFCRLFEALHIDGDGQAFSREYQDNLGRLGGIPETGAKEVIMALHGTHRLFVITNGIKRTQEERLLRSGLAPFFEKVFISDTMGVQKPQKEFFTLAFSTIPGFQKDRALIIGDSLTSDIAGGVNAGVDTCWYHKNAAKNHTDITPTYTIASLEEVLPLVK